VDPEDLVLLPGIAFDREGNRLGQGQGWYDRTFAEHDRGCLIGAGFALQVVATVPAGSRDRGVGMILTERGFTRVTRTA
jgi:5-formyltetrahydrofolate cyclo-ligase